MSVEKCCRICGKTFTARKTRVTCSPECSRENELRKRREYNLLHNDGEKTRKSRLKKEMERYNNSNRIAEANAAARSRGMSYGQYKALEQAEKYARVIIYEP